MNLWIQIGIAIFKPFSVIQFCSFKRMHSIFSNPFSRNRQIGLHSKDFYITSSRANVSSKKLVPVECSQNLNVQWLSLKQKQKMFSFHTMYVWRYLTQRTVFFARTIRFQYELFPEQPWNSDSINRIVIKYIVGKQQQKKGNKRFTYDNGTLNIDLFVSCNIQNITTHTSLSWSVPMVDILT